MSDAGVLEVRGLRKEFAGGVLALRDVSFTLQAGEFVSIVGPSGCGKSSLLSLISGLDAPTQGQVLLGGRVVTGPGPDRGLVFQRDCLFPWLNVRRNVEFASTLGRREASRAADVRARAQRLLEEVGLQRFADAYPRQLSGGMRQRAAIARALLYQPRVLLMDEPFGALDAQTREQMQELLARVCEAEGTTVLFVTHDVEEAVFLSDRVLVMAAHPGELSAEIPVPLARPRSAEVKLQSDFAALRRTVLAALSSKRPEFAA